MANWAAGHTDRFRAIVTHASLWELDQFQGTTDDTLWMHREFGDPWREGSTYADHNPASGVHNIKTPMLVIHGDLDYRVPISEGIRLWTDLQRRGVDAKFLFFPDENHWILKPGNIRAWYQTVLAFLNHHVNGQPWVRPGLL
jgi:dipeptidyl aminopeptidase/acylaminoacyl peptidase